MKPAEWTAKQLSALVGGRILSAHCQDGDPSDFYDIDLPILTVQMPDGGRKVAIILGDQEGNHPGAVEVQDVEGGDKCPVTHREILVRIEDGMFRDMRQAAQVRLLSQGADALGLPDVLSCRALKAMDDGENYLDLNPRKGKK